MAVFSHYCVVSATAFIYALRDPDTGQIRYVGMSANPEKRLYQHLHERGKNRRISWIKNLQLAGLSPVLNILDEVPESERQHWECAYIQYFRECGCDLLNGTDGGDSLGAGESHPCFGKPFSTDHCAKISAARSGKKHSPETRAKISMARKGVLNPNFGKPRPPETRAKISATLSATLNTSGFIGVSKMRKKWMAKVGNRHVGIFYKIEDAVFARNLWMDINSAVALEKTKK